MQSTAPMTETSTPSWPFSDAEWQRILRLLAMALPYITACGVGNPAARRLARTIQAELAPTSGT